MWNIVFSNGIELSFLERGDNLYYPILDKERIPLLLEEWQCEKTYNILTKIKIDKDIPQKLFKMLVTGAIRVTMKVSIG